MWECVVSGAVPGASKDCSALMCRVMDFKKTACLCRWSYYVLLKCQELLNQSQCQIREDLNLQQNCPENIKSFTERTSLVICFFLGNSPASEF